LRLDQENTGRIFRGESTLNSVWGEGETQALRHAFYASVALCNICYLLFLRRVARSFRRQALALGIVGFLGLLVVFVASLVVLTHEEILRPIPLPFALPS